MTLIQTRRIKPFPVILVGSEYWSGLLNWMKEKMLALHRVNDEDMAIINVIDQPDEIVSYIKRTIVI
jgi:hypothetical protein